MRGAGNAAVQRLLQGDAPIEVQREAGVEVDARAAIIDWLEPQREELETRARQTAMGFAKPEDALTLPGLVALIRDGVPDAQQMDPRRIARIAKEWIHTGIVDKMAGGKVSDDEVMGVIQSVLGKPGTIRVERKGSAWMEVTAGGIEIGRDDSADADATATVGWDGSVGASVSLAKVKGSFQISPDRTWQASLAFPAAATPAVLNQMAGVFRTANRAARNVAGAIDAADGHVADVSVDVLEQGLGPVKDAIDTLSSHIDKENRWSVGITAGGDFGGALSIEATITVRW